MKRFCFQVLPSVLFLSIPPHILLFLIFLLESEDVPPKQKRPRLDTGSNIFDQLTAVFNDAQSLSRSHCDAQTETISKDGDLTILHVVEPGEEIKQLFGKKNCANLISLNGADILISVCLKLPFLKRNISDCERALSGRFLAVPKTLSEALTARNR